MKKTTNNKKIYVLYVGTYKDRAYCASNSKYGIITYFQSHRGLKEGQYDIERIEFEEEEIYLSQRSIFSELMMHYDRVGNYLPNREIRWIQRETISVEDAYKDLVYAIATFENLFRFNKIEFKDEIKAFDQVHAVIKKLKVSKVKKEAMLDSCIMTHPILFMEMKEFIQYSHYYREEDQNMKDYKRKCMEDD